MKKLTFFFLATFAFLAFQSCEDEEMHMDPDYHAHIMSPSDNAVLSVGEMVHVHVNFEDHHGGTVHHVNVRIYNEADGTEIYNEPGSAHVHETSGKYEHHDDITLDVDPNTKWVLEAKVWGHESGEHEAMESITFEVQ